MSLSPCPEAISAILDPGAIPLFPPPHLLLLDCCVLLAKLIKPSIYSLKLNSFQMQSTTCIPLPQFCSHFHKQRDELVSYREETGSLHVTPLKSLSSNVCLPQSLLSPSSPNLSQCQDSPQTVTKANPSFVLYSSAFRVLRLELPFPRFSVFLRPLLSSLWLAVSNTAETYFILRGHHLVPGLFQ